MDGARDYHTKQNKLESERRMPHDIIYVWNLNTTQVNAATKQEQKYRYSDQTCGC